MVRAEFRRLVKRALASWPIWLAAAALLTVFLTVKRARTPAPYTVSVVLRASEGPLHAREQLGVGALRVHLRELTFTRPRLLELMRRNPAEFPGANRDPDLALEDLRSRLKVDVSVSDIIQDEGESAPRSARITLSFTAATPEGAWKMTHELANLAIDSAIARQRAALLREQAGAESALEHAETDTDTDDSAAAIRAAAIRFKETGTRAAEARLGVRAAEEQQSLRFELVDPGFMPSRVGRAALVGDTMVTFAFALVAACLLAGAIDPRVIDAGDLVPLGIRLVGHLPSLPGPRRAQPPRHADEPRVPPSGDSSPRV